MRYYTTPSVQQARTSVFWSLFFIFLLYFTAPCLAVLAKYDVTRTWWAASTRICPHGRRPGDWWIQRY
jgi:Na+(H+)/acetate symporter ActP